MEHALLHRARWRLRGAWQWPAFAAMTVVDTVVGHLLPPSGQTQSLPAAALAGLALNLIGVILLSAPLGALLRRARHDLPRVVARNYAGTAVVIAVSVGLLAAGIAHSSAVAADSAAVHEAIARAQAFIGDRAPAQFRRNVRRVSLITIEAGSVYRACVPSASRTYCVVVDVTRPWGRSVRFDGYEPNSIFSEGTG